MMPHGDRWEIRLEDEYYPHALRDTPEPPAALYGYGDPSRLVPGLAVIGSRKATPYGEQCAGRFSAWAAEAGVTVISGAAIGCDIAAHEAAIAAAGETIAVLGCGADVDYPRVNSAALKVMRQHHVVLSECPWSSPPQKWAFRRRNRIIAGLAVAVLVVEAGLPSGTFSTADYALSAGREVLAVPGSILAPESRGANRLIAQGATPITCEDDLRSALVMCGLVPDATHTPSDVTISFKTRLLRALVANPMRPDDLAFALRRDIISVATELSRLEIEGQVQRCRDGKYAVRGNART